MHMYKVKWKTALIFNVQLRDLCRLGKGYIIEQPTPTVGL